MKTTEPSQKLHNSLKEDKGRKIDPVTTVIPMICILIVCLYFIIAPEQSTRMLADIRFFLGDTFGSYYLMVGLGTVLISLYLSFSDIGNIVLGGQEEKPLYGFWLWGAMVFTCGLAADILFYSLCEWIYYSQEAHVLAMGPMEEWAGTYTLFHWGPTPWSFYAVLAAAFGFMLHVRGVRKQKFSEACRPILKEKTDGIWGKVIDVLAIFALIAGTGTTFSVATPLLARAIPSIFGAQVTSKWLTICILIAVCVTYTISVMHGIKGVEKLSNICMALFGALLAYVFLFGGQIRFTIENGLTSIGNVFQNFIALSTWTDPLRETNFPQVWTIFYWAYWIVWCVAAPFFMGQVSRGRTVRQVILGSYLFGIASTYVSFIILGNYGLGAQMAGKFDFISIYTATGDLYETILRILETLPMHRIVLVLLVLSMIAFYASSFDSITLVACQYSYKETDGSEASLRMKLFWAVFLIFLPIALIFSEGSMNNLQTVSIIAAFPLAMVIMLIIASFIKDAKSFLRETRRG